MRLLYGHESLSGRGINNSEEFRVEKVTKTTPTDYRLRKRREKKLQTCCSLGRARDWGSLFNKKSQIGLDLGSEICSDNILIMRCPLYGP